MYMILELTCALTASLAIGAIALKRYLQRELRANVVELTAHLKRGLGPRH
jgi:hypothetical protein